jgi:hypothetical protein
LFAFSPRCSLDFIAGLEQRAAGVTSIVRPLPEITGHVLPTGFDVRNSAAAVTNLGRELGLVMACGPPVGS